MRTIYINTIASLPEGIPFRIPQSDQLFASLRLPNPYYLATMHTHLIIENRIQYYTHPFAAHV